MFGESDSESPRAGSPWDSFIASIPSLQIGGSTEVAYLKPCNVPKLVPEVEYGNIEYKLRLLDPSPERFTRLVTQLKWRLLEGGGHAYYELGVADSGHLVGLSRADLEASLETLEMMAGKIGASVVVVKEVEIPGGLLSGSELSTILTLPSGSAEEYHGVSFAKKRTVPNAKLEVDVSKIKVEDNSRIHSFDTGDGGDASGSFETVTFRIFLTHESLQFSESLINYYIEICTVYKPRPQRTQPPLTVPTKQGNVGSTKPKPRNGKWVNGKRVKYEIRGDNKDKDSLPSSSVTGIKLETSIPVIASSMDSIASKAKAFTLNDTGIPMSYPDMSSTPESRFIVEALVVRKLALGEAYIDFGGFALNG